MKRNNALNVINIIFPAIGIGLMIYYRICDTLCSSLKGTLFDVELEIVGIIIMAVLLIIAMLTRSRCVTPVGYLRTMILSGSIGGEILLVRFQIMHDVYCPYCLAFGTCILILFAANYMKMNRLLALGAFLVGTAVVGIFFKGYFLPLYG
jgi:uncharacterized membrane protein